MEVVMFCWRFTTDLGIRGFACKDSTARIGARQAGSKGSNCERLFTENRMGGHLGTGGFVIGPACNGVY